MRKVTFVAPWIGAIFVIAVLGLFALVMAGEALLLQLLWNGLLTRVVEANNLTFGQSLLVVVMLNVLFGGISVRRADPS